MSNENQPVHRVRLSSVSAAIFKNETEEGRVHYNTQFDRSYKDGDDWRHTRSFSRDDLLNLAKVADLAHSWIHAQQQAASGSGQPDAPTPEA